MAMGCATSVDGVDETSIVPVSPSHPAKSSKVAPAPEILAQATPSAQAPSVQAPMPELAKPEPAKLELGKPDMAQDIEQIKPPFKLSDNGDSNTMRAPFPVPEGWKVVCRLSPSDVRSRWGTRPRPAQPGKTDSQAAVGLEADLVLPELNQPLRLPLQLLPQWTEPREGVEFAGRYQVKKALPDRPGLQGPSFEVFDKQGNTALALRVCQLGTERDVKVFVDRLQLESLDSEDRLFLRLRDAALALPGRLAIIEDLPSSTLWLDFERLEPGTNLVAKIAAIASTVLGGLCRLHAHGWAHCGVSPQTVCLALDGNWKLSSLDTAKKVKDITASAWADTATPPEALLGLSMTEKVDVWQLAASLCEALTRKRISSGAGGVNEKLVSLVDFLGPLPSSLVAQHPDREELFTPEGHVLRPTTPGIGEQSLEAIEPPAPQGATTDSSDYIPRPRAVTEALSGVEGATEIIEFLGRLLHPDPEQRPSATEAMAHHFLRFAHTKGGAAPDADKKAGGVNFSACSAPPAPTKTEHARIQDSHGDNQGHIARKGTGFVNMSELPPSDDEDEDEEEEETPKPKGVTIEKDGHAHIKDDKEGGHENSKLARKGTGFVHMGELEFDDEDDEEEEETAAPAKKVEHAKIQDSHGDNESKLARKGTGFVHVGDLPCSDEEDDEEEEEAGAAKEKKKVNVHAQIQDSNAESSHEAGESKLHRKGTGFVNMDELPLSDDEEEEEEESKHVKIAEAPKQAAKEEGTGHIARKGTGFVHVGDLPASDDEEDEEEAPAAAPAPKAGGKKVVHVEEAPVAAKPAEEKENKLQRKGTGFVYVGELPPSDEEGESDEDAGTGPVKKAVSIHEDKSEDKDEPKKQGAGYARKGTGFVVAGELPDDTDSEEEERPQKKTPSNKTTHFGSEEEKKDSHPAFDEKSGDASHQPKKPVRKGTGFVQSNEIPDTDDEEDEDPVDAPTAKKKLGFEAEDQQAEKPAKTGGKVQRKGTGFVHVGDLGDSDYDDEDED